MGFGKRLPKDEIIIYLFCQAWASLRRLFKERLEDPGERSEQQQLKVPQSCRQFLLILHLLCWKTYG